MIMNSQENSYSYDKEAQDKLTFYRTEVTKTRIPTIQVEKNSKPSPSTRIYVKLVLDKLLLRQVYCSSTSPTFR